MAHPALHFSLGYAIGTAVMLARFPRKWRCAERVAASLRNEMLFSLALGLFSLTPGALRFIGFPAWFCGGWWMNLFVFHHLINLVKAGGMLVGEMLAIACFAAQYAMLVLIMRRLSGAASAVRG